MFFPTPIPGPIRELMVNPPKAGEGVNLYIFKLAIRLIDYRDDETITAIIRYCTQGCGRVVPEREIFRAIENAKRYALDETAETKRPPKWPAFNEKLWRQLINEGLHVDIRSNGDPYDIDTKTVIDALFPDDDTLLCCGRTKWDFATLPKKAWPRLHELQFICPNPMLARTGLTQEGKDSAHCLSNTGARRFLVIEFDHGTDGYHRSLLTYLAKWEQLVLIVHSGGKSLHGWFYTSGLPEEKQRRFMERAVRIGADPATWTRSQFVRMPGGIRDGGSRQRVLFYNPGIISSES